MLSNPDFWSEMGQFYIYAQLYIIMPSNSDFWVWQKIKISPKQRKSNSIRIFTSHDLYLSAAGEIFMFLVLKTSFL